jgi:hypothetical protein
MSPLDTIVKGGKVAKIYRDDNPGSPRDWDNLGTLVCFHRSYSLGDKGHGFSHDSFEGWDDLEATLRKDHDAAIVLPLYLYDHSGLTISTSPFSCPFDSGRIGVTYVTRAKLLEGYSKKRLSPKLLATATRVLEDEVKAYDQFLRGDVYGYVIEGEEGDSCWGFYGIDEAKEAALESLETV